MLLIPLVASRPLSQGTPRRGYGFDDEAMRTRLAGRRICVGQG
jgi:hypothetical protein